jgi:hypothetical protein
LAAQLQKEPGLDVKLVEGKLGELTVQVDGKTVAKKTLLFFKPSVEKVLKAVREAGPDGATS